MFICPGGVSELKIGGVNVNIGGEAVRLTDVEPFQVCQYSDCQNGGNCIPYNNRVGYTCQCPQGFAGARCEMEGSQCFQGV